MASSSQMPKPEDGKGALSKYVLSEAESRRIFEEQIAPAELGHLEEEKEAEEDSGRDEEGKIKPRQKGQKIAVFLVGQTGAGKTRTAPLLRASLAEARQKGKGEGKAPAPAHFIADTYKTYHPAYASLVAGAPHLASPATGPDARRWLAMACERAVSRGADVLVESACRHPADLQDLVRLFASSSSGGSSCSSYAVRIALLAVPEALSRLGILVRYYQALPEARSGNLPLRLTPRRVHDDSFAGLLDAAAWLDRERPADEVVVLRRGNRVAYRFPAAAAAARAAPEGRGGGGGGGGGGVGEESSAVASSLLRERRRPLSGEELRLATDELEALRALGGESLGKQILEIEELLASVTPRTPAGAGAPVPHPSSGQPDEDIDEDGAAFPELRPFDHVSFVSLGQG